jgi:hypothetical protein
VFTGVLTKYGAVAAATGCEDAVEEWVRSRKPARARRGRLMLLGREEETA